MEEEEGKRKEFDPTRGWDIITATTDNGVIWHNYAHPRRIVVTHGDESPNDVADREDEEKRKGAGAEH